LSRKHLCFSTYIITIQLKYVGRERKMDGIRMIIIFVAKVSCTHLQEMQEAQLNTSNVGGLRKC
jgi:hypothetical protein